jgi:hypothetical protein
MNKAQKLLLDMNLPDKFVGKIEGQDLYTSDLMVLFSIKDLKDEIKSLKFLDRLILIFTGYLKQ